MKIILMTLLTVYFTIHLQAQQKADSSTVSLDILQAPVSPAGNLLGISNSQIQKPTDPTAFATTINQATNNFSALPTNYAIDIAPAWIWGAKNITHEKYMMGNSDKKALGNVLWQSLVISLGTKSTDSLGNITQQNPYLTKFSSGFKISILRGNIDESYRKKLKSIREHRLAALVLAEDHIETLKSISPKFKKIYEEFKTLERKEKLNDKEDKRFKELQMLLIETESKFWDSVRQTLPNRLTDYDSRKQEVVKSKRYLDTLSLYLNKLEKSNPDNKKLEKYVDSVRSYLTSERKRITETEKILKKEKIASDLEKLKAEAGDLKLKRYGFKLDLEGGAVWDFKKQNSNKGTYSKGGAWVTFGWDWTNGLSALFIGRWLFNPDQIFADDKGLIKTKDNNTYDFGGRLIYSNSDTPFSISTEGIYRSVDNSLVNPSWRLTLNAEYDFSKNKKLTFIFGRDFNGTVTKDGNLVAALNLLLGFGSKKNIL